MKSTILFIGSFGFGAMALATAAIAGELPPGVPEPELGFGMAAAVLVGAGYTWLKRRIDRG